jgi:TRAP-type C4-dicarboxylate transport system substrate-binding protein
MSPMRRLAQLTTVALAIAANVAAGCGGVGGTGDKAGGSGPPVVLRLANTSANIDYWPAIEHFAAGVRARSGGALLIQFVNSWGEFAYDAEQQVVRAVAAGKVDLGWSGARVFDTLGVTSFQALQAPMLIDSYALEDAVVRSDLPGQMLPGLNHVGVAGVAILADGLRKPIAVKKPILHLADWRGIGFGTYMSQRQSQAIRALGATPMPGFGPARAQAVKQGILQGYELNLHVYDHNLTENTAPYVTANVNLWPQMDILFANPRRLAALTEQQRRWLQQASQFAATDAPALADRDVQLLRDICTSGGRFADASPADLAALQAAFAPVYTSLEQDPQTKGLIEQIRALKLSTPAEAPLSIPAGCTGEAPQRSGEITGAAPAALNGTYRYVLTKEDAARGGEASLDPYPTMVTPILKDGRMDTGPGEPGTTYSVAGDRITFYVPAWGYRLTFTFSVDSKGSLHLTPVLPMDKGDRFVWATKVWTKIG